MTRDKIDEVCAEIVAHHRKRRFAMKQQQKLDRALESHARINYTEWNPDLPEKERTSLNKKAMDLVAKAKKGEGDDDLVAIVAATEVARGPFDNLRKDNEKEMEKLAKQLPAYAWVEEVKGAGALGLATIIAEAGPLHNYSNPQKLQKRLGYAPYDGHAGSTWKRETWRPRALTKEEWVANPFSGQRYALMTQVGLWLVNAQWIGKEKAGNDEGLPNGPFGEVYAARRAKTMKDHPDWTPIHRRNDAIRITMKEFLTQLWCQWNGKKRTKVSQKWRDIHETHADFTVGHPKCDNQRGTADPAASHSSSDIHLTGTRRKKSAVKVTTASVMDEAVKVYGKTLKRLASQ